MLTAYSKLELFDDIVASTAPDDAFLSTATGRDTAYIAVHQFAPMPYEAYFRAVEAIMESHGGKLRLSRTAQGGTTFTFGLPA